MTDENIKYANIVSMVIGAISVVVGIFQLINGDSAKDYLLTLIIGISLLGTAYFNYKEWNKSNSK